MAFRDNKKVMVIILYSQSYFDMFRGEAFFPDTVYNV